jgi:hypothetical protein
MGRSGMSIISSLIYTDYRLETKNRSSWFMVFNATFNNISVISWRSVLLVEEAGVPGENHRPASNHWQTLSHNVVLSTPRLSRFKLTRLVVIDTYCIDSCKSNYHAFTNVTAPNWSKRCLNYIYTYSSHRVKPKTIKLVFVASPLST